MSVECFTPEIAEILNREFTEDQISQKTVEFENRKGESKSFSLDYVSHAEVTRRLNEAFGHAWSFSPDRWEVIDKKDDEIEVYVYGKLTVTVGGVEIIKGGFGVNDSGAFIPSVGDKLKSASSDCLKKCASLFGIALHLYDGDSSGSSESGSGSEKWPPEKWIVNKYPTRESNPCPVCLGMVEVGAGFYHLEGKVTVHQEELKTYLDGSAPVGDGQESTGKGSGAVQETTFSPPDTTKAAETIKTPQPRPNIGTGPCKYCGELVNKGQGFMVKDGDRAFLYHPGCDDTGKDIPTLPGVDTTERIPESSGTDGLPF